MVLVRTLAICVGALAALTMTSSAQTAGQGDGRRVALVIGNAAYGEMGVLTNPVRDAKAVSESLKVAGFNTVVEAEELDVDNFQRRLREFRRVADGSSIAVIYFAGHGMEVYGQNWLIPLGAQIGSPGDLPLEAVALEQLLRSLSGATTKVLILDACRNNPFARSIRLPGGVQRTTPGPGGLAPVNDAALSEDLADGLVVMYAAAPGATANDGLATDRNSPFARALVEKLPTRGVDFRIVAGGIRDLTLRYTGQDQRPFMTQSLGEQAIYFAAAGAAAPSPATPTPSTADATRMFSRAKAAAASGDCQALKDFMGVFPVDTTNGEARRLHEACIASYLDGLVATDLSSISRADIESAAKDFNVGPNAIRAVLKVEGVGTGYGATGRPLILFEPHLFSRYTERRYDQSNPAVSYQRWGEKPYPSNQAGRWAQLREAYALDPEAAVSAASWGSFQILGRNYGPAGYSSATEFVAALSKSNAVQLRAVMTWIRGAGLRDELQRKDWEGFARGYNGSTQVERYGRLLGEAYARLEAEGTPDPLIVPDLSQPSDLTAIEVPPLGEPAPLSFAWLLALALAALGAGALTRRRAWR